MTMASSPTNTSSGQSQGGDFFFPFWALAMWMCFFLLFLAGVAATAPLEAVARPFFFERLRDMVQSVLVVALSAQSLSRSSDQNRGVRTEESEQGELPLLAIRRQGIGGGVVQQAVRDLADEA